MPKINKFDVFSESNSKTTAPKFGSWTFLYWPYYYYKNNFDPAKFILDICEQAANQIVHGLYKT